MSVDMTVQTSPILSKCVSEFGKIKQLAEGAISQLADSQLHEQINPLQNSVAAIMQHLAGNMASRFTDFLTSDGEKPNRDRESEFVDRMRTRAELMSAWEAGWKILFDALSALSDTDLGRTVYVRKEPHTVFEAINRQTAHYSLRVGQILLIAKHLVGAKWKYLTIAPGGTAAFNKQGGL